MYVKICGIDTPATAVVAEAAGANAIGVVINQNSPRRVSPASATEILAAVSNTLDKVLVVNDMPAIDAARIANEIGADVLQLHGPKYTEEDFVQALQIIDRVWRATSLRHEPDLNVGAWGEEHLLLDAPKAGSGERWDLTPLTANPPNGEWLLAGGLDPSNVAEAIRTAHPWGVDVSSGVESAPGVKDHAKVRAFISSALTA